MPILKVEKLRPKVAQNTHDFKQLVGGNVGTRTQASRAYGICRNV